MKKLIYIILIGMASVQAQLELPTEYTAPRDIVSMNSDLDYATAINLLSEYAVQSTGKPIFDPTQQTGTVGVDIENMAWEKALQVILSRRGLWYTEKNTFFEIVPMATTKEKTRRGMEEIDIAAGYREVLIETIFFEASRRELAETGVDWNTFYDGQVDISAEALSALTVTSDQFAMTVRIPEKVFGIQLDALLKLFETNNIGNVLAQPRVVVTEGNLGTVQVGQDFSIKTRDFAGNLTDEFFSVGTILEVTPFILYDENGRESIVLQTRIERSNATPDAVSTIVNKSEASSIIQMFDGEQTLIAGLYTTEHNIIRRGLPLLKDLPWWFLGLRYLFGYNAHDFNEKELVIMFKVTLLPTVYERHGTNYVLQRMTHRPLAEIAPYRYSLQDLELDDNNRAQPTQSSSMNEESIESIISDNPSVKQQQTNEKPMALKKQESEEPETENQSETEYFSWDFESQPSPPLQTVVKEPLAPGIDPNLRLGYVEKTTDNFVLVNWQHNMNTEKLDGLFGTVYRQTALNELEKLGHILIQKSKDNNSVVSLIDNSPGNIMPGDIVTIRLKN